VPDTISVILVTCNSSRHLRACLRSIRESLDVAAADDCEGEHGLSRFETLVVDNGSTDDSTAIVGEMMPQALLIRRNVNLGFAAGANIGAERAGGNWLLFVNPDTELDSDAITRLLAVARRCHDGGAFGARMRYPDGRFQPTCRKLPTSWGILFSRGSMVSRLTGDRAAYTLPDYAETTPVPAVAGTVMLMHRTVFFRVGGFDPRFFLFMEDTDICRRLQQLGYVNYFVPEAGAVHYWGQGSRAGRGIRARRQHVSVWRYFRKHHPGGFTMVVLPLLLSVNFLATTMWPRSTRR
jgi:GT2 family glycosyltransferase